MIAPPKTTVPLRRNPTAELFFPAPPGAPDRMQQRVALQQQAIRGDVQAEISSTQRQALLDGYVSELQKASGTEAKQALANKVNEFMSTQRIATPAGAIKKMTGMRDELAFE